MKLTQDTYTAQELANLLKLNVDTVRKRAKAGKIPGHQDKNGRWTFYAVDLQKAGVLAGAPAPALNRLTDVIFVVDRSGSMSGLLSQAKANLQAQINEIRKSADPSNRYRISIINFNDTITPTLQGQDVLALGDVSHLYQYPSGGTKLYDALLEATRLSQTLDTKDPQHAFLISVVTDGEENASANHVGTVAQEVRRCTGLDRYTFVYAGPHGSKSTALQMGIPEGNATTWEQTLRGTQTLGMISNTSLNTYTRSRSVGQTKSASFYAAPVTKDADKFANQLDNKLDDVSGQVKVERVTTSDPVVIAKFCDKKFGSFPKGHIYYQLTESEKVQDYKKLIVQDTTTGNFFTGNKAKTLLGVPNFQGTVRIRPGALGEFKIFVQSTSVNRKLTPGTAVVYLP